MTALKPGDKLYHVCELDPPGPGLHSWEVRAEEVEQVRRDGVVLGRMVHGKRIHRHHAIGTVYHRDPDAAVRAFRAQQERAVESGRRAVAEAERAMAWAEAAIQTRPAESVGLAQCPHCIRGFRRVGGVHVGSQRLGMIPDTPCGRVLAAYSENPESPRPWLASVDGDVLRTQRGEVRRFATFEAAYRAACAGAPRRWHP